MKGEWRIPARDFRDGVMLSLARTHGAWREPSAGAERVFATAAHEAITAIAWEPGGNRYAALARDGTARVYARGDGEVSAVEASRPDESIGQALAFEPGSTRLLCAGGEPGRRFSALERLDWSTGTLVARAEISLGIVASITCAPDGSCAWLRVYQHTDSTVERRCVLWSLHEDRPLLVRAAVSPGHFPELGFRAEADTGALVAELSNYAHGKRERYDTRTGELRETEPLGPGTLSARIPSRVEATPDRTRALWLYDNGPPLIAPSNGALGKTLANPGPVRHGGVDHAWFSLGDEVLVLRTHVVQLRSLDDGRQLERLSFESVHDRPSLVALSPSADALLVATEGGVLVEFDLKIR